MFSDDEISALTSCRLCPRECNSNRFEGPLGYCKSSADYHISSICVHKGEEPVLSGDKGICNVFFSRCNLQCIYCQNHEISRNNKVVLEKIMTFEEVIQGIRNILQKTENIVGFVSPAHFIPHVKAIIRTLKKEGLNPVFVYNTNGYEKVESLQSLEGLIDIYLPDFKYSDPDLSFRFSQARDYPEVAGKAIKEMFRQKGASLRIDDRGIAESGMIIRHLVLPNHIENSVGVLKYIAEELSPRLHISLMAQYFPPLPVKHIPELNRTISKEEYKQVVDVFHQLGFYRGWVQALESQKHYRPSFENDLPFEI